MNFWLSKWEWTLLNIKIRMCGTITNETTLYKRPNDLDYYTSAGPLMAYNNEQNPYHRVSWNGHELTKVKQFKHENLWSDLCSKQLTRKQIWYRATNAHLLNNSCLILDRHVQNGVGLHMFAGTKYFPSPRTVW